MTQPPREPTPEQRALALYKHMQAMNPKPTQWDLACFCVETLALLSAELVFLQEPIKRLVSILYTAHNATPDPFPSCLDKKP